jgi:hypothetical protein
LTGGPDGGASAGGAGGAGSRAANSLQEGTGEGTPIRSPVVEGVRAMESAAEGVAISVSGTAHLPEIAEPTAAYGDGVPGVSGGRFRSELT